MTVDEFRAGPATILDGAFPGEFTAGDERGYMFLLGDYEAADVMRALKAWRGKFRPAASELREILNGDAGTPTFDEMFALLFSTRGALAARGVDGTKAKLAGMHPLVASFALRQGIQRLKELPVHDEDDGHWRVKELREAWAAHCEAMEGREIALLARGSGELTRLDPLAALERRPALPSGDQ